MKTLLFCIPLKKNHLTQFQNFVKGTSQDCAEEWKAMLKRYDIANVKIWHKNLNGIDYAFVYHETGPLFDEKIKNWGTSPHLFDQWFDQQIMAVYDAGPIDSGANCLLELKC